MKDLVSVEYCPLPDKKIRFNENPLCGCIGETFSSYLNSLKTDIPVRFPLAGIGSYRRLLYDQHDPFDKQHFLQESINIPKHWLKQVNVTPVSLYNRVAWQLNKQLVGSQKYMLTKKFNDLKGLLTTAKKVLPFAWFWKREWNEKQYPASLFVEARAYGIDTIITTYDSSRKKDLALQIVIRPCPTKNQYQDGVGVLRCVNDVIILASDEEFINYNDGISIEREITNYKELEARYQSLLLGKQVLQLRRKRKNIINPPIKGDEVKGADRYYAPVPPTKQIGE